MEMMNLPVRCALNNSCITPYAELTPRASSEFETETCSQTGLLSVLPATMQVAANSKLTIFISRSLPHQPDRAHQTNRPIASLAATAVIPLGIFWKTPTLARALLQNVVVAGAAAHDSAVNSTLR